jgi:2-polyprenyl-6-methoxyphenol hydroxylase-like FAD-dependent oxidoreductase
MDTDRDILISGASVAGPALAYWLSRRGFRPTVVERAPQLRGGGYAVDFRGRVHLGVLAKMGLLDQLRDRQTNLRSTTYVDTDGHPVARMPAEIFAGDVEILRGDLGQILYEATRDDTEYIFGDSITAIEPDDHGVLVSFEHAAPRPFGLVVGADGLHSTVRRLVFGEEAEFVRDLGYYVSIFTVPNTFGLDHAGLLHSVPGRTASVFSAGEQAIAQFYFAAAGTGAPREMITSAFAGVGWLVPELLAAMEDAPDFYFDSVSQVHLDRWSSGRVSLIGDAAAAAGPGGNGTGNAVVAAYVLAGELAAAGGDYRAAFERYERLLRPYVAKGQKQAKGGGAFLAPATQKKIQQRDRMLRMLPYSPARPVIKYLSTRTATGITLPSYALEARAGDDHRLLVVPAALPVPHVSVMLAGAQPLSRDRRPLGRRGTGGGVAEIRYPADAEHGDQAEDRELASHRAQARQLAVQRDDEDGGDQQDRQAGIAGAWLVGRHYRVGRYPVGQGCGEGGEQEAEDQRGYREQAHPARARVKDVSGYNGQDHGHQQRGQVAVQPVPQQPGQVPAEGRQQHIVPVEAEALLRSRQVRQPGRRGTTGSGGGCGLG